MKRVVLLLGILAWAMLPGTASGQNGTVGRRWAVKLEPAPWDLSWIGAAVAFVARAEDYRFDVRIQDPSSPRPAATVTLFETVLQKGYGWLYVSTHAEGGGLMVETHPGTAQGQAARDAALAAYRAPLSANVGESTGHMPDGSGGVADEVTKITVEGAGGWRPLAAPLPSRAPLRLHLRPYAGYIDSDFAPTGGQMPAPAMKSSGAIAGGAPGSLR